MQGKIGFSCLLKTSMFTKNNSFLTILPFRRAQKTETIMPGKRLNKETMLGSKNATMTEGDGRRD